MGMERSTAQTWRSAAAVTAAGSPAVRSTTAGGSSLTNSAISASGTCDSGT